MEHYILKRGQQSSRHSGQGEALLLTFPLAFFRAQPSRLCVLLGIWQGRAVFVGWRYNPDSSAAPPPLPRLDAQYMHACPSQQRACDDHLPSACQR